MGNGQNKSRLASWMCAMLFVWGYFCATNEEWKSGDFGLLFVRVWCHDFGKIWQPCTQASQLSQSISSRWLEKNSCRLPRWVNPIKLVYMTVRWPDGRLSQEPASFNRQDQPAFLGPVLHRTHWFYYELLPTCAIRLYIAVGGVLLCRNKDISMSFDKSDKPISKTKPLKRWPVVLQRLIYNNKLID